MIKKYYKEIIILASFFVVSVLACGLYVINSPRKHEIVLSGNVRSIFPENLVDVIGYDVEDNTFVPNHQDPRPRLLFELGNEDVHLVNILLSEPLISGALVEVYYNESMRQADGHSRRGFRGYFYKGAEEIQIIMPLAAYSTIRIDINKAFAIDQILISNDYIINEFNVYSQVASGVIKSGLVINVFAIAVVLLLKKHNKVEKILDYVSRLAQNVRQSKRKLLLFALYAISMVLVSYGLEILLSNLVFNSSFIWQRFLFILTAVLALYISFTHKGNAEKTFLVLSLTLGIMIAIITPISESIWDDDDHYRWAVQRSLLFEPYLTYADLDSRSIHRDTYYNREQRETAVAEINSNAKLFLGIHRRDISQTYRLIGHIPSGIGIFFGKVLGLPWSVTFIMGRLGNLFAYSTIVYHSIKRLKYGKYVVSVIALTPTIFYAAANYSYDSWVFAWLLLGTSYFLSQLHEPNEKASLKDLAIMILSYVIGLGPKAVYFPVMFILFFVGKNKIVNPRYLLNYRMIVAICILLIVSSFAVPFFSAPEIVTDMRGGENVSSPDQLSWILQNPFNYSQILIKHLLNYLNPMRVGLLLANYSFIGRASHYGVSIAIFFTLITFFDNSKDGIYKINWIRFGALACSTVTIVLFSTALYIGYTPVGHQTINGVQYRYLLPLLPLTIQIIRPMGLKGFKDEGLVRNIVFCVSGFYLLSTFWYVCVSNYH